MASGPNTSWEIDGKRVEPESDFILQGSKITADGDCSHEIKTRLLHGKKVMTNLDSIFKSRDITLATKVHLVSSVSSVTQSCPTLCDPKNCNTPGLPVHHHLPEFTQTHVHRVRDAIQPSHPRSSPSPAASNPSQHQSLFQ